MQHHTPSPTIDEFTYELPKELIAQEAVHPYDSCKLMHLANDGTITHHVFRDIVQHFRSGDVLVVNQTKVRHAKIIGQKITGGRVEVILTKSLGNMRYEARIKASKMRKGLALTFKSCSATVIDQQRDVFTVAFDREPPATELHLVTPPYIKKSIPEHDYQTMFAKQEGSLAAPTASLHFTPPLMEQIRAAGVEIVFITLHIGFGTFLPVRDVATHATGSEAMEITASAADRINAGKRVIAVGTTVVKALETASKNGNVQPFKGASTLFIKPGHQWQARIDAMITNFHLPHSSLLMLVAGYAGTKRILDAYHVAVQEHYRFYSLGDAMFIERPNENS